MNRTSIALAACLLVTPLAAWADGLSVPRPPETSAHWQARLEFETALPRPGWSPLDLGHGALQRSARLFGDYHLDALRFGHTGGLRLTSGLVLNQRIVSAATDGDAVSAWPYLGIGYSGAGQRGDWGFSADVGMAAQSLGAAARLGRVLNGGLSVGDALRDLRLQPMVRLGVTYNF